MTITREDLHVRYMKASAERNQEGFEYIYDEIYNSIMKANAIGQTLYESNCHYTGNPETIRKVVDKLQKVFIDSSIPERNKLWNVYTNRIRLLFIELFNVVKDILWVAICPIPTNA
jgi:hypothetical protein